MRSATGPPSLVSTVSAMGFTATCGRVRVLSQDHPTAILTTCSALSAAGIKQAYIAILVQQVKVPLMPLQNEQSSHVCIAVLP